MLDILKRGRDEFGYVAVKAEFEAEGTRTDELLRLMELARKAGLDVGLKIGGCEAVRDLIESKQFGVEYVIAPMIESSYALSKYIDAKNKVYAPDQQQDTRFLFNIETRSAYEIAEELVKVSSAPRGVNGIVFGRVDFTLSCGYDRDDINDERITECCVAVAEHCHVAGQDFVVGGGVSKDALPALYEIRSRYLSRFETRKVIFSGDALDPNPRGPGIEQGFLEAVRFEMLWLLNKRDYYVRIGQEDERRIDMLERRWSVLESVGQLTVRQGSDRSTFAHQRFQ